MFNSNKCRNNKERQQGVVLLFIISILILGSAAFFLSIQNKNQAKLEKHQATTEELQKAKEALIAYAVNYSFNHLNNDGRAVDIGPGHLPCPDLDNSGSPNLTCGEHVIGRLPMRWLIDNPRVEDADSQFEIYPHASDSTNRFWYMPSRKFLYSGMGDRAVNPDTVAEITVDGVSDIVAVIIDPGDPVLKQTRPSNNVDDYLEGANADGDANFVTSAPGAFNDRLIFITKEEMMPLVERVVLHHVSNALIAFDAPKDGGNRYRYFPFAAPLGDVDQDTCEDGLLIGRLPINVACAPGLGSDDEAEWDLVLDEWVANNQWEDFIYYHIDLGCANNTGCEGPAIEVNIDGEMGLGYAGLVAMFGTEIDTEVTSNSDVQVRSSSDGPNEVDQYLDTTESTDGDLVYEFRRQGENNNDYAIPFRRRPEDDSLSQ